MSKMRKPFTVLATLIFTLGGVSTAIALVQIYQMNNFGKSVALETAKLALPVSHKATSAMIQNGDLIGTVAIPEIDEIYPIIEGTTDSDLKRGVGHFAQSVMPGVKDNSVLSGHRDSVFSKLGELKVGSLVIVRTRDGVFTYSVFKTRIVLPDDRTVIVPTPTAVLTLTTCYPFIYFGNAPKRYIVSAQLIKSAPPV